MKQKSTTISPSKHSKSSKLLQWGLVFLGIAVAIFSYSTDLTESCDAQNWKDTFIFVSFFLIPVLTFCVAYPTLSKKYYPVEAILLSLAYAVAIDIVYYFPLIFLRLRCLTITF